MTSPPHIPIPTLHLFPVLDQQLIDLLQSLRPEDWEAPTLAKLWRVKDLAAHLLDGNLRTLSMLRDGYLGDPPGDVQSYQDLVAYLNQLNANWVAAAKRLSPQALTAWLAQTGREYCDYLATLDPFAKAAFSVAWAGEAESQNWFHIAREYTEKWHHQQQIREATNRPGLMTRELFYPFIDTFMRGMPHAYRNIAAADGTTVQLNVTTEIGGSWFLLRREGGWHLIKEAQQIPDATITIDPDTAWKLFTKGIRPEVAKEKAIIHGNVKLAEVALSLIAVMA